MVSVRISREIISAAVLTPGVTPVTVATGFGEYAGHVVSRVQAGYLAAGFFNDP